MSSSIGNCLYPTLKAARLLGLLPCTNLQDKGRFQSSKYLSVATRIFSLFLLAPFTTICILRNHFKPKSEIGDSSVFRICFGVSSVLYVCFQSLVCWNFIGNICLNLTQSFSGFRSVEQIAGVKFDVRLKFTIQLYQVLGILVAFVLCVKFFLSFLTNGEAWELQVLINFTRLQMYVVEQLIVTLSLVFAMCYQQLSKCIENFQINTYPHVGK